MSEFVFIMWCMAVTGAFYLIFEATTKAEPFDAVITTVIFLTLILMQLEQST